MHGTPAGAAGSAAMDAEWTVPPEHPALAGHFPGRPIVPGALLLDRSVLLAQQALGPGPWDIVQAKFLHPVSAGARLRWRLAPTPRGAWSVDIHSGQTRVATLVLARGKQP